MFTLRRLLPITTAAVVLTTTTPARSTSAHGRADERFWGESSFLNPQSGLNLDRSSAVGRSAVSDLT